MIYRFIKEKFIKLISTRKMNKKNCSLIKFKHLDNISKPNMLLFPPSHQGPGFKSRKNPNEKSRDKRENINPLYS